ncbi:MAG: alanine racemase, partial [Devosia sp.]|nr:alanine racemase [Devosia sp.]
MRKVEDLETPVVTIDLDRLGNNIRHAQDLVAAQGIRNRPHIKTHKIPDIARMQIEAGAAGLTCQKLSEAEVFIDAGVTDDILITFNIVGEQKTEHLMRLSDRIDKLTVVADNEAVIRGLSAAGVRHNRDVPILIENDVGFGRNGVQSPEAALSLARFAMNMPRIRFEGLMAFPTTGEKAAEYFTRAIELFKAEGIPLPVVSGGGTPAMMTLADFPMLTEHRAGTYVFNDVRMVHAGYANWYDCALTVRTTVVSTPTADRAIVDAGSKALTREQYFVKNFGRIVEYPGAVVANLSEEHGVLDFSAA